MDKRGKQTTLLQTWGYEGNNSFLSQSQKKRQSIEEAFQADDGDDDLLAMVEEQPQPSRQTQSKTRTQDPVNFEHLPVVPDSQALQTIPGFDPEAGRTWIYPTNYPVREYQETIVKTCLFRNTLVSLPTGLGKTFIAAVVMYNYFRWYPQAKIVFMAPTKPLVAQQIEACFEIMGIPQDETAEMTGNIQVSTREQLWRQKRVFFLTPQVMKNDLTRGLFPAANVKLLVVDEAHRAQGEYAYCNVVKELQRARTEFRVVALSATPGNDLQSVKLMLQNLVISKIELRSEDSPDIVPYTFERKLEKVVVPIGKELGKIKQSYMTILEEFLKRLANKRVLCRRNNQTNPSYYTKFGLIMARDEFRQNPPSGIDNQMRGSIEGDFSSLISLYHGYELLDKHGLRPFFNYMQKITGELGDSPGSNVNRRVRYELQRSSAWTEIVTELKDKFSNDSNHSRLNESRPQLLSQFGSTPNELEEFPLGHPKLERLRDTVINHFKQKKEEKIETRVMIFSQYRDSVSEITAMLHRFKPLVKVMEFVGQSGTNGKKGLTQKEQIAVVKRFKEGGYNTLVATCVGEEGLDIGEVDLIVCYDVSKSPISLVQRMGRTGRKRAGRIVVLVTEGKEEQSYNQSMHCKKSINKAILDKQKLNNFLSASPRMVPFGIEPVCHKMIMRVGTFVSSKSGKTSVGPEKNKKITSMMKKADKGATFRKSCGFLSDAELQEFTEMFPNTENLFKETPRIKPRREIWNTEASVVIGNLFKEEPQKYFDLSDWNMWQEVNQERFFVTPSRKSHIFCEVLKNPLEKTEVDDDIVIFEEKLASPPTSPFLMDIDDQALDQIEIEQSLFSVLDDDPYRQKYSFDAFAQDVPADSVIDAVIKRLDSALFNCIDLTEALRCFRAKKMTLSEDEERSPSPVFLSQQSPFVSNRETSTPLVKSKSKITPMDDYMTPVPKRNSIPSNHFSGAFDDSFVELSKEEKSLYNVTALAAMLGNSMSQEKVVETPTKKELMVKEGEEVDLFPDSSGHFDSINFSDLDNSRKKKPSKLSLKRSPVMSSKPASPKKESPPKLSPSPRAALPKIDFDIVTDDFFDDLEQTYKPFKQPDLDEFEMRLKHSPIQPSQSPLLKNNVVKKRPAILSSSEEEEEDVKKTTPKRPKKSRRRLNKFIVNEAELSGSASEDEDDEENLDGFEKSFVDDATQRNDVDLQAMYLRSIKSPQQPKVKRTISKPFNPEEIFSQPVTDSMLDDDYEEDSFVAKNDEIEYASSDELDFIEEFESKKPKKATTTIVKKRKRIIMSSSDDDEEESKVASNEKKPDKLVETPPPLPPLKLQSQTPTKLSSSFATEPSTISILINGAEVHKSGEVISLLKHEHNLKTFVHAKFNTAGFLLSTRLAVCHVKNKDFCNGANRHEIVKITQTMNDYFDKPFLIIESPSDFCENNLQHRRTKYVDMIISQLAQTKIRVLYSTSDAESALLMSALAKKEAKKGYGLPLKMELSLLSERYLPFYLRLPGTNYALALQMALTFKNPISLIHAVPATIARRLKIDEKRAQKICSFFEEVFHPGMISKQQ